MMAGPITCGFSRSALTPFGVHCDDAFEMVWLLRTPEPAMLQDAGVRLAAALRTCPDSPVLN